MKVSRVWIWLCGAAALSLSLLPVLLVSALGLVVVLSCATNAQKAVMQGNRLLHKLLKNTHSIIVLLVLLGRQGWGLPVLGVTYNGLGSPLQQSYTNP